MCEVKSSLAAFAGIESHPIGFLRYLSNFTSFALGPNRTRAGKKTAICQEQIKVAGGSAQRLVERRPVGDFRHPHRDHIYCLPSASC